MSCVWCPRAATTTVEIDGTPVALCAVCAGLLSPFYLDEPEQALDALDQATRSFEQHLARVYRNPDALVAGACWWCLRPGDPAPTERHDRTLTLYRDPLLCRACAGISGHIALTDDPGVRAAEARQTMLAAAALDASRSHLLRRIHLLIEYAATDPDGDMEGADLQTRFLTFAAGLLQLVEGGAIAPGVDGGAGCFVIPRALNEHDYSRGIAEGWPDSVATANDLSALPGGLGDRLIQTEPIILDATTGV